MEKSFGEILRELRLNAGIGLRELARMIDRSPGYLSGVEQMQVAPPSEPVILAIASALGVEKKILLEAAKKVDPEISEYMAVHPEAADFFRMAKERAFETEDWERLAQLADLSRLGKQTKDQK